MQGWNRGASMDDKDASKVKGGRARADKLDPERRKEIASQAATARWRGVGKPLKATHAGVMSVNDLSLECANLPDGRRVVSEAAIMRALGRGYSGYYSQRDATADEGSAVLPRYVAPLALKPFISKDLHDLLSNPIAYTLPEGSNTAKGIEAQALPKICRVWIEARNAGKLTKVQQRTADLAEILSFGFAEVGIAALIDEATGYQEVRDRKALQEILNQYIGAELAKWAARFSNDFYKQMCRLKGLEFNPASSRRPYILARITIDVVYDRIGPGLTEELKRKKAQKLAEGGRDHRLHQWLTEKIGIPALDHHLTGVTFLGKSFTDGDWDGFHRALDRVAPAYNRTLPLDFFDDPNSNANASQQPS